MSRARVLVVEDDPSMQDRYKYFFEHAHKDEFEWLLADDGEAALKVVQRTPVDVMVLDIQLPGMSGLDVLRVVQKDEALRLIPVIVVSAQSKVEERVVGLRAGADDYLPKPFHDEELLARLESIVRRKEKDLDAHATYDLGWLKVDVSAEQITVDGEPVRLEPKEFALLRIFVRRPNVIHFSKDLHERVWGYAGPDSEHAVGNKVSSLRGKLGRAGACLVNHKGIGYSFDLRLAPKPLRTTA